MSYATIEDLRSQLGAKPGHPVTAAYAKKMLHEVPAATVVDRQAFFLGQCTGKRVLEFGASGLLSRAIVEIAAAHLGVDRAGASGIIGFDLDDVTKQGLPGSAVFNAELVFQPDVIVCGEVLEHLTNPGWFLQRLRAHFPGVAVLISVPNAFASSGRKHMARGLENVNKDHVAWYSPTTLWTLLERYGYKVEEFHWYHGEPYFAEGLIVVAR